MSGTNITDDADLFRMVLRNAAATRTEARQTQERAQRTIVTVLPQARDAGVSVQEAASILGITRQGVYFLLRDNPRDHKAAH